jgi:hypothetical protein
MTCNAIYRQKARIKSKTSVAQTVSQPTVYAKGLSYGPFVYRLYFRLSSPEALHVKRHERLLLVKDGIGREMARHLGLRFQLPRKSQSSFTCRKSATLTGKIVSPRFPSQCLTKHQAPHAPAGETRSTTGYQKQRVTEPDWLRRPD